MNRDSQLRLSFSSFMQEPSHDGIFGLSPIHQKFGNNNFQMEDM